MKNDLKSSEALKAYAREVLCGNNPTNSLLIRMFDEIIDNAPPATDHSVEIAQKSIELGRRVGRAEEAIKNPRPQCECEKCDFRKFTERFIDGAVDLMNKYGITSFDQLSEKLKGGTEE